MLAHALGNLGPALAVALPQDVMPWVLFVIVELSAIGMLPVVFATLRRRRGRAASFLERPGRI
jgi:hypothetical protein